MIRKGSYQDIGAGVVMKLDRTNEYGDVYCDNSCGRFVDPYGYTEKELKNPTVLVLCDYCILEEMREQDAEIARKLGVEK